ncbi:MAG: TonB-dependent receptor plug domain-containing protein, partial [Pseudomonadota bacterium]
MGRISKFVFRKTMAAAFVSPLAVLAAAPLTMAQATQAEQSARSVDIAAGPLGDVLLSISAAFDVNVIADEPLVEGKLAPKVSGTMTVNEALLLALGSSDLIFGRSVSGAFIIATPQKERAIRPGSDLLIVQGTKLPSSLQETDTSVEIFTAERLDREEIIDLSNLFLRVPNVTAGSGFGNDFSIRGIGRTGATGAGTGIASNVYVDGAPLSVNALLRGPVPLWDVAQTEILRGPQSTVQGRNALA